jgi:hypothetical protein
LSNNPVASQAAASDSPILDRKTCAVNGDPCGIRMSPRQEIGDGNSQHYDAAQQLGRIESAAIDRHSYRTIRDRRHT